MNPWKFLKTQQATVIVFVSPIRHVERGEGPGEEVASLAFSFVLLHFK